MSFEETYSAGHLHERDAHSSTEHECRYYTMHPAPTQWVAIGITTRPPTAREQNHRLLVGEGQTETAAIRSLRRRCQWMKSS